MPFLYLLLRHSIREMASSEHAHGLTMTHINRGPFLAHQVLVPPLGEQHRIVAKVDELMTLCERLEAARAEREATRGRLTTVSLGRLNTPDADTFQEDARFVLDALPAFTARLDQIKQLRQTILNLAVRGKLVRQNLPGESSSKLPERSVGAKSGRAWTQGLSSAEPYPLPRGWIWTRIADTARRVTVGYVGPMKDQYVESGIPFIRSQNVRPNCFRPEGITFISEAFHREIAKSALKPGDVVIVRSGNVGTACVIPAVMKEANCSDVVIVQEPDRILPVYLCFYLNSLAASYIEAGSVGVALTHFNTKSVATMPIPLPPFAEQHRIVAKVNELMGVCDQLEASLTARDEARIRLLNALLVKALQPPSGDVTEDGGGAVAYG